jgi:small subunit ribosomal protein S13
MAVLLNVHIPENKRGIISITKIYGIGPSTSKKIFAISGVDPEKRVSAWTDEEAMRIRSAITDTLKLKVEGELRSSKKLDEKRLIDIRCYRGNRKKLGLPSRGQRTKTNARTTKGKPKTVAGKKKATK